MSSSRWGLEQYVTDLQDIEATSMALDATGRFAALAGQRNIVLADLDSSTVKKKVSRNSKWPVTCSEWSKLDKEHYAFGYSKVVEVYSFAKETPSFVVGDYSDGLWSPPHTGLEPLVTLKGHTRNISDVNWSPTNNKIIATASHDSTAMIWDTRDSKRACVTFSSLASTNQVKWSKVDEHVLATAHDADIRIWDRRKGTNPVHYIAAHISTINCLDWSSTVSTQLASSSTDGSVKFWDLSVLKNKAEMILQTPRPIWRALYTPFENGIITSIIPKVAKNRPARSSLYLWHINNLDEPAYRFVGEADAIIDFGWRQRQNYEAIIWAKDRKLRVWTIDPTVVSLVQETRTRQSTVSLSLAEEAVPDWGLDSAEAIRSPLAKSPKGKPLRLRNPSGSNLKLPQFEKPPKTPTTPTVADLQLEFALININIPNLNFDEINSADRFCTVSATSADRAVEIKLKISFPLGYPNAVPPNFVFLEASELKERRRSLAEVKSELLKTLQSVAHSQVRRTRPCLEPCLRSFMTRLEKLCCDIGPKSYSLSQVIADYSLYRDSTVPFPRTSGARFCGADILVFFGRPPHLQQISAPTEFTPRALSDLSSYLSTNYKVMSVTTPATTQVSAGATGPPSDLNLALTQMPAPVSSFYQDTSGNRSRSHGRHHYRKSVSVSGPAGASVISGQGSLSDHSLSSKCGPVFVYNVEKLMSFRRKLGESYTFCADVVKMCTDNAKAAHAIGRKDLFQSWSLAALAASPNLNPSNDIHLLESPWPVHPFGRKMVSKLLQYYLYECKDVQTVAMLACAFSPRNDRFFKMSSGLKPHIDQIPVNIPQPTPRSAYHTVHGPVAYISSAMNEPFKEEWNLVTAVEPSTRLRSNSWSDSVESESAKDVHSPSSSAQAYTVHCNEMILLRDQQEAARHEGNLRMIDAKLSDELDKVKLIYGDLLLRWGLYAERAMVLKYVKSYRLLRRETVDTTVHIKSQCVTCKHEGQDVACPWCRKVNLVCVICRVGVRGLTNYCQKCGHGGHSSHMRSWFDKFQVCPTGCGCICLSVNAHAF
ncbi:GATOR complex protein WDR59 [Halotydeus destructor]|nr:GATOR complex protein WDR59 [Halotydeus destructor]